MASTLSPWLRRGMRFLRGVLAFLLAISPLKGVADAPVPTDIPGGYPHWWFQREVIPRRDPTNNTPRWANHDYPDSDDFAVANVGQLKQMASQAAAEFNAHFPNGAGTDINNLVNQWVSTVSGSGKDDFSVLNLGQLKAVAKLFYDRLLTRYWVNGYPWQDPTTQVSGDDYRAVNIGQLKSLFSFDLSTDSDGDGIPDWVQTQWGVNLYGSGDEAPGGVTYLVKFQLGLNPFVADTDGDGATDGEEIAAGTNPLDPASSPFVVVSTSPTDGSYGFPLNGVIILHLSSALPDSITSITPNFVIHSNFDGYDPNTGNPMRSESVEPGTAIILPGRKSIAFVSTNNLAVRPVEDDGFNYIIRFNADTAGLATIPVNLLPVRPDISFATNQDVDNIGPAVNAVSPGVDYVEVAYDITIGVLWSEALDPATVNAAQVTLWPDGGAAVPASIGFDYETNVMKIVPQASLSPDTLYNVTLGTGFANLRGIPLQSSFMWSFRTRPLPTPVVPGGGPYAVSISPARYSGNVPLWPRVSITFSEDMDASTLNANTVTVTDDKSQNVSVSLAYSVADRVLTLSFGQALAYGTRYEVDLNAPSILSVANPAQTLQGDSSFVFTTVPDPQGPDGGGGGGSSGGANPPDIDFGASGGSNGNKNTDVPPLTLTLVYGDGDNDAGGNVNMTVKSQNGSSSTPKFQNADNGTQTVNTSPLGAGSIVTLTPTFQKGSDNELTEETPEVNVKVSVSKQSTNDGALWMVFLKTGPNSSPTYQYLGQLSNGPYSATYDDGSQNGPQSLLLVPVNLSVQYVGNGGQGFKAGWISTSSPQYLGTGEFLTQASVANVQGVNIQLNILQDIRSTTTLVFEDGSYGYCSTDNIGGYLTDVGATIANPSVPGYTTCTSEDHPTMKVPDLTRPYMTDIHDDGDVRDYVTVQINGGDPQTIAEVDWSFKSAAYFTVSKMSSSPGVHQPTNFQSVNLIREPQPPKKFYGSSPQVPPLPRPSQQPTANVYFNTPGNWIKVGGLANKLQIP